MIKDDNRFISNLSRGVCTSLNLSPSTKELVGSIGDLSSDNNLKAITSWLLNSLDEIPIDNNIQNIKDIRDKLNAYLFDLRDKEDE